MVKEMEKKLMEEGFYACPVEDPETGLTAAPCRPGIIRLESILLDLGCVPDLTEGLFYMFPVTIQEGKQHVLR